MKKKSFASFTIIFSSFKKQIKKFSSMEQNLFFFIRNLRDLHLFFAGNWIRIWGHLNSAGIALQLYSALRFEWLKSIQKSRAIPWDFWDEFFSLSMPSVCPHLTTVWDLWTLPFLSPLKTTNNHNSVCLRKGDLILEGNFSILPNLKKITISRKKKLNLNSRLNINAIIVFS